MLVVVMGVSGSGKSTIGQLLADQTGLPFYDADDYHPSENIQKMSSGQPLTDEDRMPWLHRLAALLAKAADAKGAILACSALKERYRAVLNRATPDLQWIYLSGDPQVIKDRMSKRTDHFMSSKMLQSQLETLEVPKYGIHLSIDDSPDSIVQKIIPQLKQ